jgi:hypothetical protein
LPFSIQSFPFSVLHETNKLDQEIQLIVFKPILTAGKYDRNNKSNEEDKKKKKSDFSFFRELKLQKSRFKKKLTLRCTMNDSICYFSITLFFFSTWCTQNKEQGIKNTNRTR